MPRAEHTKNTRIVVTEISAKRVGMVVDSVSEVLRLPLEAIEDAPEIIAGVDTEYIRGVGKIEDRLIILLDLARVIRPPRSASSRRPARSTSPRRRPEASSVRRYVELPFLSLGRKGRLARTGRVASTA